MTDRALDFWIFNTARDRSRADIEELPKQEVQRASVAWLQSWTEERFVDWELIEDAGELLGRGGAEIMEQEVMCWAGKDLSLRHWEIAAAFLRGYWRHRQVGEAAVLELLLAVDRCPDGEEASASIALTLVEVLRSQGVHLAESSVGLIRDALTRLLPTFEVQPRWQGLATALKAALAAPQKSGPAHRTGSAQ